MKKYLLILLSLFAVEAATAQLSVQNVLLEEFTGTWCPYCSDGAVRVEAVLANNQNVIASALHVGAQSYADPMQTQEALDLAGFYNPNFPEGLINRDGGVYDRGQWQAQCNATSQSAGLASVSLDSVSYDPNTRELRAKVLTSFTGNDQGEFRFNLFITEDNVTGPGNYAQYNSENGTPGHPYYQAGNPIPFFNHMHVLRAAVGGTWGVAGNLPSQVGFGTQGSHWFTYTIPANYDPSQMHLIGAVQKFGATAAEREIINVEEAPVPFVVSLDEGRDFVNTMELSPNPTNSSMKVYFDLNSSGFVRMEVLNTLGQRIAILGEGFMNNGAHSMYWNGAHQNGTPVENGIYLVRLITENGQSITRRAMVAH